MMKRRKFLKAAGAAAVVVAVGVPVTLASIEPPRTQKLAPDEVWCRPQTTVEDLVAEWCARQNGEQDGFDKFVEGWKEQLGFGDYQLALSPWCPEEPCVAHPH